MLCVSRNADKSKGVTIWPKNVFDILIAKLTLKRIYKRGLGA